MSTRTRIPDDPLAPTVAARQPERMKAPVNGAGVVAADEKLTVYAKTQGSANSSKEGGREVIVEDVPIRTTIVIPRSLHRGLKSEAHRRFLEGRDSNVSELIAEAVTAFLKV